ncbi:ATP-binding protein [Nonomuraea sp. NPDC050790]|uniref:ATP-binding protein n=1 Tax=Nonomuraea sp. NPDC050790 TaxID=3364371 RepID=UPI0037B43A3C
MRTAQVCRAVTRPEHWPITWDLSAIRARIEAYARGAGLAGGRVVDLIVAVNEAVINVLEHAGGAGRVSVHHEDDLLTVDVVDYQGRLAPERARPAPPAPDARRGFGMWVMAQLCDGFTIDTQRGRTRVRLRMSLPPTCT